MNQCQHSGTHVVVGLFLVLSGILITKGETTSCRFETKCAIKLICLFPNGTDSEEFTISHTDKSGVIIHHYAKEQWDPANSSYDVTYNPITVWIRNAAKTDAGRYYCDMPQHQFNSTCNLTEKEIDDLKICGADGAELSSLPTPTSADGAELTSLPTPTSDSRDRMKSGMEERGRNTEKLFDSDSFEDSDPGFGFAIAAGIASGALLLVLAIIAIFIFSRRRRLKKSKTRLHSAHNQGQTSHKYAYSSVSSDAENGGVKHDDESSQDDKRQLTGREVKMVCCQVETENALTESKALVPDENSNTNREDRIPEVLPQPTEKPDSGKPDDQLLHGVIELLKGLTNSPGGSDSPSDTTDKAATNRSNVTTKVICRRGADGSFEISLENSLCSPDNISQKEPAIAQQEPDQLELPLKAFPLAYKDMDLKTSIDAQELTAPDVYDILRNNDHDNREPQQPESDSVKLKPASSIKHGDIPEEEILTQASFPHEKLQESYGVANDSQEFTGKAEQTQESPGTSKIIHEQCQKSDKALHELEADITLTCR